MQFKRRIQIILPAIFKSSCTILILNRSSGNLENVYVIWYLTLISRIQAILSDPSPSTCSNSTKLDIITCYDAGSFICSPQGNSGY